MKQDVFVNRILNIKKIKYIGLDMDHTLIRYQTRNFEATVYELVIERLIQDKAYPEAIRQFQFNFEQAVRGLVVDCKNGNILKLSRFAAIKQSYHGLTPIPFKKQQEIYHSIYIDLSKPEYVVIDTAFSIAFCSLYSQLVDYKDKHPQNLPNYIDIVTDVLRMVDVIHADGSLKKVIAKNLSHYVIADKAVVEGIQRYLRYGKKFFILTNSDYWYTRILLDFTITPFLEAGQDWQQLFEYVITLANKPRFFYDDLKYLTINPEDGTMTNLVGPLVPGIYQGGYAKKFTQDLHLTGDDILYIGDHIYGDVLRLKKECNWRTALVIEELGAEIKAQIQSLPIEKKISQAMSLKETLEEEYVALCSLRIDAGDYGHEEEIAALQHRLSDIDTQIIKLLAEKHQYFNPFWDRIFRAGAEESFFASQVDRYACIYMEKLSDLLAYSPMTYFRAFQRPLAHEQDILSLSG